ncbi:MAG: aminodeoxychorismate/anthranilate synthase component II [Patescibacteria group bacterium]
MKRKILIVDHFDSFTYNLQQYVGELESDVVVARTNVPFAELKMVCPTHLILSPGPGHPGEVECFSRAIEFWESKIPILGVCLGHQALALAVGAKIERNHLIMHGKESFAHHNGQGIFKGLKNPLTVMRYHSLVANKESCEKKGLEVTAWTDEGEIMGIRYRKNPLVNGIQFHPESLFTEEGKRLLMNFLEF